MPASFAAKLGIQFARFAAASSNAGQASFRSAFNNATAGSSTSASSSSWAQGLSSSGSASANGAGIGGAKFHAGRGAHSTFSQSGRAIANANASSSHDAANSYGDDDDDLAVHQARIHRPGQLHRSNLLGRNISPIPPRHRRQTTTTLPALQLIMPRGTKIVQGSTHSPHSQTRTVSYSTSSSANQSSSSGVEHDSEPIASLPINPVVNENVISASITAKPMRRHVRSHSMDATTSNQGLRDRAHSVDVGLSLRRSKINGVRNQRKSKAHFNEADGPEADSPELDPLRIALSNKDSSYVIKAVEIYRRRKRSEQSVAGFNMALEALLAHRVELENIDALFDCYLQMVQTGFSPNASTYMTMVTALCSRDLHEQSAHQSILNERGTHEGQEFSQAMAMFTLAHASNNSFTKTRPYDLLLGSCAIRGEVPQACTILETLSLQSNLIPTATTFANLILTLSNDSKVLENESKEAQEQRILSACTEVFEEMERRRAEGQLSGIAAVTWNAYITACFNHHNASLAMGIAEKMLLGTKLNEKSKEAPMPIQATSDTIITKLAQQGEILSALDWIDRLIKLNGSSTFSMKSARTDLFAREQDIEEKGEAGVQESPLIEEGDNRDSLQNRADGHCMPLPRLHCVYNVIKLATMSIPMQDLDSQQIVMETLLPITSRISALQALVFSDTLSGNQSLQESDHKVSIHNLKKILFMNSKVLKSLSRFGKGEEEVTLLTTSLRLINDFFTLFPDADGTISTFYQPLMPALLATLEVAQAQERVEDAASLFTYAVECQLRCAKDATYSLEDAQVPSSQTNFLALLKSKASNLMRTEHRAQEPDLNADEAQKNSLAHRSFVQTMEVLLPSFQKVGLGLSQNDVALLVQQYADVRRNHAPDQIGLSVQGWNSWIQTMKLLELSREKMGVEQDDFVSFLSDLASLPESIRKELQVDDLSDVVRSNYSLTANAKDLEALGFAKEPKSAPSSDETLSSPGLREESVFSENTASSMTTDSLLDAYEPPASLEGKEDVKHNLPAIQLIDEDFGETLIKQCTYVKVANRTRKADLEGAYAQLMSAIRESGTYPSIQAISHMLTQAGRVGRLERVHQLYVIGCHVLGAMAGDTAWQSWAWAVLENGMIRGLAHCGEAKTASNHRHRLLSAGRVPDVDAYGALIAVVRDTTDDALIAQELYEESQRLGVQPNVYLYNTVISKLCRARKLDKAMRLYDEMLQRGFRPTAITYGSMVNGFTRTGDESSAEQMFNTMEQATTFHPKAPPYNNMIQFYTYTRPDREKALSYYARMLARNVEPSSYTYRLLLDVHGVIEPVDVAGMERVFGNLIADAKVRVDGSHWASIINTHGIKAGDLAKAISVFDSIPNHIATLQASDKRGMPDAVVYEALLNVFLQHNRTDLMQAYVQRMRQSQIRTTAYLANIMIRGLASNAQGNNNVATTADDPHLVDSVDSSAAKEGLMRARALFEEMDDPPMGVAAVGNHPVNHRHHANDVKEVPPLTTSPAPQMASDTFGFRGVLREPSTFETMIRIELAHGNAREAAQLVERMQARGYPPAIIARAYSLLTSEDKTSSQPVPVAQPQLESQDGESSAQ